MVRGFCSKYFFSTSDAHREKTIITHQIRKIHIVLKHSCQITLLVPTLDYLMAKICRFSAIFPHDDEIVIDKFGKNDGRQAVAVGIAFVENLT